MKLVNQSTKAIYVKLNLEHEIIAYNQNFIDFFDLRDKETILGKSFREIFSNINENVYLKLQDLCENKQKSLLIFRNHHLTGVTEPLVSILYAVVIKEPYAVVLHIANWLNWIWQINSSINKGYNMIAGMEESVHRKKIRRLLEMYWFKALSPLLLHIPNGFIGMINSWACFDILKIFNNKRGENIFSKDYSRDTISRVRHCIKRDRGLKAHVDISEILKNKMLINLQYNDELFIPHSMLEETIILTANKDTLLEEVLNMYIYTDIIIKTD
ncbi:MAG: hypothetical protein K0R94_183 [Burkholderiales bacterium]|nr:hypothetical protein [Burkholderiales bacterium]